MQVNRTAVTWCLAIGALAASGDAMAARRDQAQQRPSPDPVRKVGTAAPQAQAVPHRPAGSHNAARRSHAHLASAGGISCVPYARAVTGMQVYGNGGDWWGNAAGLYDRGRRPEPGSVMAFRATGGMVLGHVAVVRRVVGSRELRIDHANWGGPGIRRGSVMQDVSVIDVSRANDWSEVRVQSGYNDKAFGRVYPTYGFIYNRPDDGPAAGTAYAGLQHGRSVRYEQLAEMPEGQGGRAYSLQGLAPIRTAQARATR